MRTTDRVWIFWKGVVGLTVEGVSWRMRASGSLGNSTWAGRSTRPQIQRPRVSPVSSYRRSEGSAMTMEKNLAGISEDADFMTKLKAAWRIFFPEKKSLSPKEEGKNRLRMILVADRCGMSSDSLVGMRESIVKAMTDYVEIEAEEAVEVNMSMDPEVGTIYSVAVPIKRVRPTFRRGEMASQGTSNSQWDPQDPDSDPADQFPWGT
ncbi:Cell division topological specificity factor-like protein [Picochlorum sp. SENEW3]|nr:Cell division topological specificity factor-like protein [Picochlorum sp. SENEW3]WPT18472.1 Cell division topological specificity factor-like protein [Picochlorum sp. SENEW3]